MQKWRGFVVVAILGIATGFDAMAIDMYLPAFSFIQRELKTTAASLQMSMSLFLLGLALGQALFGYIADRKGRKNPLIVGFLLFSCTSVVLAFSSCMEVFLLARFFQGIGAAAGLVISRAIVIDLYKPGESGRVLAILMQVATIAPVLAPPFGGVVLNMLGWRYIWGVLAAIGIIVSFATFVFMPESLPEKRHCSSNFKDEIKNYGTLFCSKSFIYLLGSSSAIMGALFVYIAGASFIFMEYLDFSPEIYSVILACNAIFMMCGGQLSIFLLKCFDENKVCKMIFPVHIFCAFCLCVFFVAGIIQSEIVFILIVVYLVSMSPLFGPLTSLTMISAPDTSRGAASAVLGIMQYLFGFFASFILGILQNNSLIPMAILFFCCSGIAAVCWYKSLRV